MRFDISDLLLIFVLISIFYFNSKLNQLKSVRATTNDTQMDDDETQSVLIVRDDRPSIAEPKRYYDSKYHSRDMMRINVPTRGEAPPYQQVGYLGDTNNSENIKPLYGRQTYRGSNQWNYFTSLDSHLATKIPLEVEGSDCTDDRGCKELQKNDTVDVNGITYQTKIYQTHAPRYVPY